MLRRTRHLIALLLPIAMTQPPARSAPPAGYLFVTFKGEQSPLTEQIYFATSRDGREWSTLNNGAPMLISDVGEKGVRDPYLLRARNGKKFFLIGTDLSINRKPNWQDSVRQGSQSIVIWESEDLVNWSKPRLVKVAPDDAGCTWAPEAVYDEETDDYLVFWASTTARDNFAKHCIWAARTKDFVTFGPPFVFIEKPATIIDTTIVRDGLKYYRFTKDEKHKAITMESASSLMGTWADVPGFSLDKLMGYEGPEIYPISSGYQKGSQEWCLILDHYSKGNGYQPWMTKDLSTGQFEPAAGFKFPFKFRHGSILPLNERELKQLEERWNPPVIKPRAPEAKLLNIESSTDELVIPVGSKIDLHHFDPQFAEVPGVSISPSGPQDFSAAPVKYTLQSDRDDTKRTIQVSVKQRNNPVLNGYYADPDIIYSERDKKFYLYPTTDGVKDWNGSSFHAFSSTDLVSWKDEGVILDLGTDVSWADHRAWAPCMAEKKTPQGWRYYYYYCAEGKIGVATGANPTGPFQDSGRPIIAQLPPGVSHGQQIDPAVFRDPGSGKYYLYWGNQYLAAAELAEDMLSIKEDTLKILTPDKTFREAVTVFFRAGRYYFLWSEDDTRSENYRVRYATAPSPLGPLEIPEDNLVIAKEPSVGIYATGHNSVVQIPGRDEWYIVYHRFTHPDGISMGPDAGYHREVCIDRLAFGADGSILRTKPTHEGITPVVIR